MAQSVIGALRVNLGLDSAQFSRGAKQAQGTAQRLAGQMQKIGAAISVVGAGILAVARGQLAAAEQIGRQAQIAGTGVVQFQRVAVAARQVGFEAEKVADILKDVGDKVGDFLSTGGGPLKDFFENIAPQIGVTAEQFRNLSGADALQLYVSSLEKANLSQSEMTFYMEAIANDATALIPLLANNGAELNRLADAADRAGAIMSEETVAAAMQFQESLRQIGLVLQGVVRQIAADLAPTMAAVAQVVADTAGAFGQLSPEVRTFAAVVAGITVVAGPAILAIGTLIKSMALLKVAMIAFSGPVGITLALLGAAAGAFLLLRDNAEKVPPPIEEAKDALDLLNTAMGTFSSSAAPEARTAALNVAQGYREQATAAIQAAEAELALMEAEAARFAAAPMEERGLMGDLVDNNNAADIAAASAEIARLRDNLDLARTRIRQAATEITSSMGPALVAGADATQTLSLELEGVDEVLDRLSGGGGGGGSIPDFNAALGDIGPVVDEVGETARQMEGTFSSAFADIITGAKSAREALSSLLSSFANILAQSAGNSIFKVIAGAIGIPAFASGTSFAPGGLAVVGERGPELVNLPRGSQVFSNAQSRGMVGNSATVINIDARGAVEGVAVQIERAIQRQIPGIVQASVAVGSERRLRGRG